MSAPIRFRRASALALLALAPLLVLACSDDQRSSPTAPAPPTVTGSALILGDVTSNGRPAGGLDVSVQGQALSTRTDSGGGFRLDGVAAGDRVLVFATASSRAELDLPRVREGERIEIQVAVDGSRANLRSMRRGGGGGTTGPLTAEISPDSWNTNWSRSNGTVTLFLRGAGFDLVDPTTVLLTGDDPAELALAPNSARIEGHHLKAKFSKSDALDLLLEPLVAGETRTLEVAFEQDGSPLVFSVSVRIVGPGR